MSQPASVQSTILTAVAAALGGESASAFRCRFTPFSAAELAAGAYNVLPEDEQPELGGTDDTDLRHKFIVRCMGAAVDHVDEMIDALYVAGYKRILEDPTLGGLVRWIRYVGRKWEYQQGEVETVALAVMFEAEFSTNRSDPSVAGF